MNKIGIISGGGKLPLVIGKNLINKNHSVIFFVLEEHFDKVIYKNFETCIINLQSINKLINLLNFYEVKQIILAGNISRPSLSDIKFDLQTLKLAKNILLNKTGDNQTLEEIKKFFKEKGFIFFEWQQYCPELFADQIYLTKIKPSTSAIKNLKKALNVFKIYGKLDIGQSMILQNNIILGLECVEGTDNLIIRCKNLKKSGDKGILVKFSKYYQSTILDIPTIGISTIQLLIKNDFEGIYLEKDKCLIIDKEETIELANKNNIFISTSNKIE